MAAVTLSSKYRISVPKQVRESQGWVPGQKFVFVPKGGGFVLVPVPSRGALHGIAKGADTSRCRDEDV